MQHQPRGFTLLELMVVLLILALGAAVATPAVMRLVDSVDRQNQVDQLKTLMQSLPVAAMAQSTTVDLPETAGFQPASAYWQKALPKHFYTQELRASMQGLQIWMPVTIRFRPNGACSGGVVHWKLPDSLPIEFILKSPVCRPVEIL